MTPEMLDRWRILPRIILFCLLAMTWRVIEWFIGLENPSMNQAALPSVMTATLTGAYGLYLGNDKMVPPPPAPKTKG